MPVKLLMAAGSDSRTILIVDDDPDCVEPLEMLLKLAAPALTILTAGDGQTGVDLARRFKPAIVIMDLEMPVLNGMEAARQIKGEAVGQAPLIVAVSGNVPGLPAALASGSFDFALPKPLQTESLLRILELESN